MRVGSVEVDGRAVMERVRVERDRFVGAVHESLGAIEAGRRIAGHARFRDARTLARMARVSEPIPGKT